MNSILVKNGNIVYPWGIVNGDILVIDGVVKCIGKSIEYNGVEKINAEGKIVLPGVVDIHVHMREPGLEYKDNFENGTRDAVQSGVTTVLDMPNTIPPVDSVERFRYKKSVLTNKAYCDFGLYGVIVDD
ncbi:MAG: dihydroorotase family protein, partial [Desulfurococcaceae archaeon]